MKHLSTLLTFLALSFGIFRMNAADYPWLTFTLADNTEVSVASDNLQMDYADGILHLSSPAVNETFDVSSLESMRFSSVATGIDDVKVSEDGLLDMFSMSGVRVGQFASLNEAKVSLPSGIYTVKGKNKTIKVIF